MATLQYSVMYRQVSRPYAAGLFTTALLADSLTRCPSPSAIVGRCSVSALRHCSVPTPITSALMLAALMGATSIMLVKPAQRKAYLIMCAVVVLLYLPDVPIFFKQARARWP